MVTLFVISTQPLSGKTALCAALGGRLMSEGLKVGYVKALASDARRAEGKSVDDDAIFMQEILDLNQTHDVLCPVNLSKEEMASVLEKRENPHADRLKAAIEVAKKGRDVLLVEGGRSPLTGSLYGLSPRSITALTGGSTVLVARYDGPATADQVLSTVEALGTSPLGVVINAVPPEAQEFTVNTLAPFLNANGALVIGVLPEDRTLMGPSVGELAAYLDGSIVSGADHADDLVEGFLLGALSTDYMQDYYSRRPNVAVITSAEKTDIQLFSMTPSTRCLILTGSKQPTELVASQASKSGIPVVTVKDDTLTVAEKVEGLFESTRFHQRRKLPVMAGLVESALDIHALYKGLGLKVKV